MPFTFLPFCPLPSRLSAFSQQNAVDFDPVKHRYITLEPGNYQREKEHGLESAEALAEAWPAL